MIDLMYITDSFPFINGPMYKLYDNEVISWKQRQQAEAKFEN